MKKVFLQFGIALVVMAFALTINSIAFAAVASAANPADTTGALEEVFKGTGLFDPTSRTHDLSSVEPGADIITSTIFIVIDFIKYLVGAIAVLYIIISGIKLITAGKKIDEVSEKEKETVKFLIYGLILIITADELVTRVFFGDYGECLASASNAKDCAKVGGSLIEGIYNLILAVIGAIALFTLVLSAFKIITAYGNEETIATQKKNIAAAIAGILISAVGEFVVKGIIFPEGGAKGIDVAAAQKLVFNFTNFIAAFIGAAAFCMLFYGGIKYVLSFGNEEETGKAKKIIISAAIGVVVAFSAYAVIRTISSIGPSTSINLPTALPGISGGAGTVPK